MTRIECQVKIPEYREQMALDLMSIIERGKIDAEKISIDINRARRAIHDDRVLRVTSRGSPITGTLLEDFGSFLDYKFREFDYYVGVYDAVVLISSNFCSLQYDPEQQAEQFGPCANRVGRLLYDALGIVDDPRGRYVFARIGCH